MIIHVDMDAFYASIEQRDTPSLRGKPVAVGGAAEGRGVVATASYEARKFGIHSAMPMQTAKRLCPALVIVRTRIQHYANVSSQIREILNRFTPVIEPLSLDEAFLDVRATAHLFGNAVAIGHAIKQAIRSELGLIASVGIGPNKFVAKIASDLKKPDSLVNVKENDVQDFLDPLPIDRIWGVGGKTATIFRKFGILTIRDLRGVPKETLRALFGNAADHYASLACGQDARNVVSDRDCKSVSSETTFSHDILDLYCLESQLVGLVESVARRLRHHELKGRCIELKMRYSDFTTFSRSMTLSEPTDGTDVLLNAGLELFRTKVGALQAPVRLLGFGVSHLRVADMRQMTLFDEESHAKHESLDSVTDQIQDRFGKSAIQRGGAKSKQIERP
jgi:DNA polymerase IV